MNLKQAIIEFLKKNDFMTQGDLSEAIYGDRKHLPNLYPSLMGLVRDGIIRREGERPAYYSLSSIAPKEIPTTKKKDSLKKPLESITNENLERIHGLVLKDEKYGRENDLITKIFKRFPKNDDISIVAMKISVIDVTNSTNLARYKSKISLVDLAEVIVGIKNIDERIKNGDPTVVNEIAKANGKINLFSFASKYCCYHNCNLYGRDDYSILDTVLMKTMPLYFDDITFSRIDGWRNKIDYESFNNFISKKLDENHITISNRKRKFDHFVWYLNR